MQVNIPKIVKKIELKGYAAEFGDAYLEVWVNPPVKLIERVRKAKDAVRTLDIPNRELAPDEKEKVEKAIQESWHEQASVYAELLSQGSEHTRLSVDEVKKLAEGTVDTDPMFWAWLQAEIVEAINAHRFSAKKG